MGIGVSLFLLAVGAILTFAVNVEASGFDINTVGIILMVIGGVGIILSMLFWSSWSSRRSADRDRVVVREERDVV